MRRTMLFLPSNNPNLVGNGGLLGADSLIFDLEDAVSPDDKDAARELLKNALSALDFGTCERIVRINGLDTPYWDEDLRAVMPLAPDAIMPPKVSGADYIHQLDEKLTELETACGLKQGGTKIIALLETAVGVENAYAIATASSRMMGLFLGAEDLTADLRCQRTKESTEILYAREGWSAPPGPPVSTPMIRRSRMSRIWTDWNGMPRLPRDWGFLGKPASAPPISPPSTAFSRPLRRRSPMPRRCSPSLRRRSGWEKGLFRCAER